MQTFKSWLKKEVIGIYPPLYDGLAAYPDAYFVNSSYKVYIDASLKAKTNPPDKKIMKENFEKVDFLSFSKTGEIKVLANGEKHIFIVDGIYVDRFRQSSQIDPMGTYQKLKNWVEKGMAQKI